MMAPVVSAARSRSRAGILPTLEESNWRLRVVARQGLEGARGHPKPFRAGAILRRPPSCSFSRLRKEPVREMLYPTRRN